MSSWSEEMNKMLVAFDHQAKSSLHNIKMALKRDGLSFNAEFKAYFLQSSYYRIKESYDQYAIISMFEDQANNDTGNDGHQMSSDESSSEDEMADILVKSESSDVSFGTQYVNNGEPIQYQGMYQIGNDDMANMNLTGIDRGEYTGRTKDDAGSEIGSTIERTLNVTTKSTVYPVDGGNLRPTSDSGSYGKSLPINRPQMKKRFKCELCQYSSEKKSNLMAHMRTHTGEKPYRCEICDMGFTQLHSMKKHIVTHTDKIPFHCRGCFMGFSRKKEEEAHVKMCKLRQYECHACKYVTALKTQLKLHMRKHSGEKPFRCEICLKHFSRKDSLRTHLRSIHA